MSKKALLLTFLLSAQIVFGTELSPWLGNFLEITPKISCLYQHYHKIASNHGQFTRHADDLFFGLHAGFTKDDWSTELETIVANTANQHPGVDCIRLTGRYRVLNDITEAFPFTFTPGLTYIQAFRHSLTDISSFHHGVFEGEFHVAFGQECPCDRFWDKRWWGLVGIGIGNYGSPWLHGELHWEKNWCDTATLKIFIESLWGLGKHHLNPHSLNDFNGYGPIRHRSIDLGMRYSHYFDMGLIVSVGYARRLYAYNFPSQTNLFYISLGYPIGLFQLCSLVR